MRKIKFFLDPIMELEPWLNNIASKGYRLVAVNNFVYTFEKSKEAYRYNTQFIGANSYKFNKEYIEMLRNSNLNIFRAPINQGNIAFGKVRLRPYSKGSGKLANTFHDYNKEILIVENAGDKLQPLLTNYLDIAKQYKDIKNAYLQGAIGGIIIFSIGCYKIINCNLTLPLIVLTSLFGLISGVLCFSIFNADKNYKKYKDKSQINER